MSEVSPFKNDENKTGDEGKDMDSKDKDTNRPVSTGGLRRIFKQRNKRQDLRLTTRQQRSREDGYSEEESEDDKVDLPVTQTTSHHYTLNMPSPTPPTSDLPYVLLGQVLPLRQCRTSRDFALDISSSFSTCL